MKLKFTTLALATALALSSTFASARSYHHPSYRNYYRSYNMVQPEPRIMPRSSPSYGYGPAYSPSFGYSPTFGGGAPSATESGGPGGGGGSGGP